ncbi:zinc finger, C2H2 type [Necator americanus]|uniref:Zinc finger, C2H2 type n=1 Tax=Necator americanus TaxID=51031 RepID=W2TG75_NECAM|nr:zinc finger, C2H2 type [Necator americanus]ETN81050.1 zinc finger, C2H2 type [Necator americanus]
MDSSCLPSVSTRSDCCTTTLVPACRVSTDHEAPQAGCDAFLSWVKRDSHNHQRVLFVCMWGQCFHEMEAKDELAAHFDVHLSSYVNEMSGNDSWICPINTCSQLAASPIDLRRHLAMHQFQAHAQYVGCGFQPSLDITYSGEVTYCLWDNCNHDFSDPLDLFTHVMVHIDFLSSDDKEACASSQWREVLKHVRHHSGEKYCACPFCGRFFSRPDKLYEHLHKRAPLAVNADSQPKCRSLIDLLPFVYFHFGFDETLPTRSFYVDVLAVVSPLPTSFR